LRNLLEKVPFFFVLSLLYSPPSSGQGWPRCDVRAFLIPNARAIYATRLAITRTPVFFKLNPPRFAASLSHFVPVPPLDHTLPLSISPCTHSIAFFSTPLLPTPASSKVTQSPLDAEFFLSLASSIRPCPSDVAFLVHAS